MLPVTREQAREIDRIAIEELGIPGIVLMENAARGVAKALVRRFPDPGGVVAVVCGPGNNGGDGFAAARHLANMGIDVRLHLVAPPETYRAGSDAATNLAIIRAMGLPLVDHVDLDGAAVVVDAVFGTGLSRPVRDPFRAAIAAIRSTRAKVVAVDLPSGLDANTGAVLGAAVRADLTATMVAPKVGFTLDQGPALVGQVAVVDIGVPPAVVRRVTGG